MQTITETHATRLEELDALKEQNYDSYCAQMRALNQRGESGDKESLKLWNLALVDPEGRPKPKAEPAPKPAPPPPEYLTIVEFRKHMRGLMKGMATSIKEFVQPIRDRQASQADASTVGTLQIENIELRKEMAELTKRIDFLERTTASERRIK